MAENKDRYKSSFGVIRCNPRISGNLKISVDSNQNIWLNSIDSNSEMSKNQYKGYRITDDSNFSQDVYSFFDRGKTPSNFIFGLKNEDRVRDSQANSLEDQYSGFYDMGVSPLVSSLYSESFSYLAPMWMGEKIPKYFVIFRIDDPIDFPYQVKVYSLEIGKIYKVISNVEVDPITGNSYEPSPYIIKSARKTYTSGDIFTATSTSFSEVGGEGNVILLDSNYNKQFIEDLQGHLINNILPKSSIVKTYSLGENSKIGKYLRKIKKSQAYSQSLIDAKFEERSLSLYNGVSVKDGVYCSKGEYLNNIFTNDNNIIEFEEHITDGFKRNDVISYNLLNLEFFFDDPDADLYSINRYFGLYVEDIPTGEFQLSGDLFYTKSASKNNFPEPKSKTQISNKMIAPFYQNNDGGVRLFLDNYTFWGYIPSSDDVHINERLKFFYVKDKNNNFYSYKQIQNYSTLAQDEDKWGDSTTQDDLIILKNKILDLSLFAGIDPIKTKEYKAEITNSPGKSYSVLRIGDQLTPGDAIVLYHPFGVNILNNKRFDYFIASDLTYVIGGWGPGSYTEEGGAYYFHPFGTKAQIAKAIADVLNSVNYKTYKCFNIGEEVIVRTDGNDERINELFSFYAYSDYYNKTAFTSTGKLFVNEIDFKDLTSDIKFIGGCKYENTRVKIRKEDSNKITPGVSYVRTNYGLSKVKFIGSCIDETTSEVDTLTIKDYNSHSIIEIEDHTHTVLLGTSKTLIVEELVKIQTGVFSMYGLKDLDIDFWSSTYGKTPTEEYYRYIDVQPDGITPIISGMDYAVAADAVIKYMGVRYGDLSSGPIFIFRGGTDPAYKLITPSVLSRQNVVPSLYVNDIYDLLSTGNNNPQTDLDKFPGFAGLQDIKFLEDTPGIFTKKDQLFFGKTDNEYDVLKENSQRALTLKSRVTPYISKWVYEGGTDVRGNDYRLNVSHAFTPLNFSPSFFSNGRDPLYFTNEWYLLENPPILATTSLLKTSSNYCVGNIDMNLLKNADPGIPDYFLNYFTVEGNDFYNIDPIRYSDLKNKPSEEKYTYFTYNSASGFAETIFRGVKVRIKERTDSSLQTKQRDQFKTGDKKFNDYKFSCILKSIEDPDPYSVTSPITFQIHQNDTFKHITFLITVIINDSRFIDPSKLISAISDPTGVASIDAFNTTGTWYYNPQGIYGGIDYFGLYSVSNKTKHIVIGQDPPQYPPADYLNWSTNNPSKNPIASDTGHVKLSAGLNATSLGSMGIIPSVDSGTLNATGIIPIAENENYDTDLREEMKYNDPTTVAPNDPAPKVFSKNYLFSPKQGNTIFQPFFSTPVPTGVGKNYINFNQTRYYDPLTGYFFNFTGAGYPPPLFTSIPIPGIQYNNIKNRAVYQSESGENYWDFIFNKLSFPEIYKLFTSDSPYIKYTRSYWDETTKSTLYKDDTFALELVKPSSFLQKSRKVPLEEDFKPDVFSNIIAGYKLADEKTITEYFRYGGGYSPKFKDVLFFDNIKNDHLNADKNPISNTDMLDVLVTLREKTDAESEYYGIGSDYEILIDGMPRKKLRLVRGNTYKFIFDNFTSLANPPSPPSLIQKDFIISGVENSGEVVNIYSKGFINSASDSVLFTIPQDAPDILYYELSGENFSGGTAIIAEGLEFKNTTLGINKESFGLVKNLNYYKYSGINPFRIDPQSGYKLEYPLIGETPIDRRDVSIFESTWDPGRYRKYSSSLSYEELPGTKNMTEDKSFFGSKVMKTPETIKQSFQSKYPTSIDDVFNSSIELYKGYEILWEQTDTLIKAVLLLDRTAIKHFKTGGVANSFNSLLVSEFGIGSETSLDDDIDSYINSNIINEYEAKEITVYIKKLPTIYVKGVSALEPIITDLSDYKKISSGFFKASNNNITRRGPLEFEYTLTKDPGYNYSVAFSFIIGKI